MFSAYGMINHTNQSKEEGANGLYSTMTENSLTEAKVGIVAILFLTT